MHLNAVVGLIKDIATTIAIVGGGAWTVYTFSALGTRARAQAERFKQAVLDISVEAKEELADFLTDGRFVISAVATVVNKGTRNTYLDFKAQPPFTVSRIDFDSDSSRGVRVRIAELQTDSVGMTVRIGASGRFPVFFTVRDPGLYVIEFSVTLSEEEMEIHEAVAKDNARERKTRIVWGGSTHLIVQ